MLAANARQGQVDLDAMLYDSRLRQNNLNTQAAISRFQERWHRWRGGWSGRNFGFRWLGYRARTGSMKLLAKIAVTKS
ncbi:hypothetical protein [Mesorhizobium sp. WSM3868]|uniref:hypothetical protein n=1 Tax=Mesorhizobium sp. WSM3868 TaxID=2029405 RepID=UPI0015CD7653|nr:hypothetical protein [Mesorhizobium sp. WSM3868]